MHVHDANVSLVDVQLKLNRAANGGSLSADNAHMKVINTTVIGSSARRDGGAIAMRGTNATFETLRLESNDALDGGGMHASRDSHINASYVDIVSNSVGAEGGGIALVNSSLLCYSCILLTNRAFRGSGLYAYSYQFGPVVVQLQNSRFGNNSARAYGGGIDFAVLKNQREHCRRRGSSCLDDRS